MGGRVAFWRQRSAKKQVVKGTTQHGYEWSDLVFVHPTTPGLNIRHNLTGHICAVDLKFGRQLFLGKPALHTQFDQMLTDVIGLRPHT